MYSSFRDTTYYVHLADTADRPIATLPTVAITTPTLKKIYQSELNKESKRLRVPLERMTIEHKKMAGERVLERLKARIAARKPEKALPAGLRLYEVNLLLRERRIEKQSQLIAEAQ